MNETGRRIRNETGGRTRNETGRNTRNETGTKTRNEKGSRESINEAGRRKNKVSHIKECEKVEDTVQRKKKTSSNSHRLGGVDMEENH